MVFGGVDSVQCGDEEGSGLYVRATLFDFKQRVTYFTGTILCTGEDILAGKSSRNRRFLDRTGLFEADSVDSHEEFSTKTKVFERAALGGSDILSLRTGVFGRSSQADSVVVLRKLGRSASVSNSKWHYGAGQIRISIMVLLSEYSRHRIVQLESHLVQVPHSERDQRALLLMSVLLYCIHGEARSLTSRKKPWFMDVELCL